MNNIYANFDINKCCGCGNCKSICPVGAIKMAPNKKGFLYPKIDSSRCIQCGLCLKSCYFGIFREKKNPISVFIARSKNSQQLKESQSGGIFATLASMCLEDGFSICSCCSNNDFTASHKWLNDKQQIPLFVGSKYIQSNLGDTFIECAEKLNKGEKVLFVGTPCQTHSLLHFLKLKKIPTEKFLCCDIVCHGVPSQKVFGDYLHFLEKKNNSIVVGHNFRDKSYGWHSHRETIRFSNNKTIVVDGWRDMYYSHNMHRESCFSCPFTTPYRESDITLSDAWGLENNYPELDDNKGWSLVIIHNSKGKKVIDELSPLLDCQTVEIEDFLQPQLKSPPSKGEKYDTFWNDYFKKSERAIEKWFFPSKKKQFFKRLLNKIKRTVFKKYGH